MYKPEILQNSVIFLNSYNDNTDTLLSISHNWRLCTKQTAQKRAVRIETKFYCDNYLNSMNYSVFLNGFIVTFL